jgi:predicted HicB family RNase H-like nuclease
MSTSHAIEFSTSQACGCDYSRLNEIMKKSEAISVRVTPALKRMLEQAAANDRRSLASLIANILEDWAEKKKFR